MGLPEGKNGQIHFGPFELDPDAEQLRRRGVALRLQPKQFVVLLLLAQRAGEIVSRQEIQQRVWGDDTFVDFDRGINFCINQIRAALGDDADRPRYIETIPRRGYRFIANIDGNGKVEPEISGSSAPKAAPSRNNGSEKQQSPLPAPFLTKRKILVGSLGLLAAIMTVLLVVRPWQRGTRSGEANRGATSVRTFPLMTFPGQFLGIALSPDASQIAFTWNSAGLSQVEHLCAANRGRATIADHPYPRGHDPIRRLVSRRAPSCLWPMRRRQPWLALHHSGTGRSGAQGRRCGLRLGSDGSGLDTGWQVPSLF